MFHSDEDTTSRTMLYLFPMTISQWWCTIRIKEFEGMYKGARFDWTCLYSVVYCFGKRIKIFRIVISFWIISSTSGTQLHWCFHRWTSPFPLLWFSMALHLSNCWAFSSKTKGNDAAWRGFDHFLNLEKYLAIHSS